MSNNSVNINLKGKNDPTVNITVNEAGTISGTGSVSPVINFVATGEQGAVGAQGQTGSLSASDSVTQANMADNSVGTNEIINGSVTNTKLANNSVYVQHIVDGSVSTSKIENSGVTTSKIADDAITASKLADNAITAADITRIVEDNAFTTALIAYGAVTAEEIANYNITNPKIADNAVNSRSLDSNLTLEGETNLQSIRLGSSDGVLKSHEDYDLIFKYDQNIFFKDFNDNTIFSIDQSGNITTLGTIDGVDVGTSVTANNAKVGITTAQANAITANTAKETNQTTDLSVTASSTFLRLESSDGADILLPAATTNAWGVMSDEDKAKLDGIEAGATADQTTEEIEDIVGNVVATGGTKTGIAITYDDANNDMDFVVDHDAATNFVADRWDNDIQSTATINHLNLSSDTPGETEVLVMNDGDAVWGHGEKIHIQVRNDEGSTISAGAPLYSKGEIGGSNRILVGVCDANDSAKMPCIGVAHSEMNTTSTKDNFAVVSGVYNTNISGFTSLAAGDNLYIQDDGSLSQTKPFGESSKVQNVGIVLKTNGTTCQGLLVSAIGRTNDVPNLDSGNIFLGNASNTAQATTLAAAIEGAGNITIDGDLKLDDDIIKGSSGNVILSSLSDVVKTPLGLFTNSISGYDNTDFELKAGGNVQFTLDVDNNETAQSFSFRDGGNMGSFTEIANLNQDGDLVIEGDLTVKGNDIKDDDGTVCITFDSSGNTTVANTLNASVTGNVTGNTSGSSGSCTGNAATATALAAGNQTIDGDVTIGANDEGHDLLVYGHTANANMFWDASNDFLKFSDAAKLVFGSGVAAADFDSSIQANGSNLVIYNDTGNIQIGDTVEVTGDLTVSGNLSIGDDAEITSVGSMVFRIDSDADESSQKFTWKNNASDVIAEINEADEFVIYGSSSGDPRILLHQTGQNNTYGPPQLDFYREDTLVDNADLGMINFIAKDSADNDHTYAKIIGLAEESGSGTEGGKIKLQVATHDGEIQTGITIEDGDAEDEIDVTIANGSSSLTTVAGKLAVGGELTGVTNFIDVKTAAYWSSSTSAIYVPISGATTSEATSLAASSYTTMFVVPFDGKVTRITSWNQGTASPLTSTFELYINGDDDPLSDQVGTDLVLTSYLNSMVGDCASDWVFTKGQTIAIRRTDSSAAYGVTMSVVLEYDTTT
jgi:hypothetical protein